MVNPSSSIPVSLLDFATVIQGDNSFAEAFQRSKTIAQQAERAGYKRFWIAEHHNMDSVASAATTVLMGHIAGHTKSIRVGSGGIMLPNHAPLIIAEQFGTLAALYPGRIDLGIGRAPGTDQVTAQALRRNLHADINQFPNDVVELINYLGPRDQSAKVRAIPGEDSEVPVWLLGSSTFSAQLAAMLGLPFAFASHFSPAQLKEALYVYRTTFKPSVFLERPLTMACVNVIAASNDDEAEYLATSFYQLALGMFRKDRRPLPPPIETMKGVWSPAEEYGVLSMMVYTFIGGEQTIAKKLQSFISDTGIDELMIATHIYDVNAKVRSLELTARVMNVQVPSLAEGSSASL
jgi:luciferase family oxidoreductase group 1